MALLLLFASLATVSVVQASPPASPPPPGVFDWPPHTLQGSVVCSVIFGLIGILLALIGFKLFDWVTPGNLQKEICENKNYAAAIVTAAVILGICHILAAAIH